MTEEVTMYRSEDGKLHETKGAADARDRIKEIGEEVVKWSESGVRWPGAALRAKHAITQFILWKESQGN